MRQATFRLPIALAASVLAAMGCQSAPERAERFARLATTTSVENSGLLGHLLAAFTRETGVRVDVLAVGSGKAVAIARRGDAHVLIIHEPHLERQLIEEGRAAFYRKVMFNDFIFVGPAADPARIGAAADAPAVMRRIAKSDAVFVSRADESGTHARERDLWRRAGVVPPPGRLLETGQGMAATLRVASERDGYCLTDRSTFLQLRPRLRLAVLYEGGDELLNTYAVIVPHDPHGGVRPAAQTFARWLAGPSGQSQVAAYQRDGVQLFHPWPTGVPADLPEALPNLTARQP